MFTVTVRDGTITVEGLVTPAQSDAVIRAVRGIRNVHRVVAALRVATIATIARSDAGSRVTADL